MCTTRIREKGGRSRALTSPGCPRPVRFRIRPRKGLSLFLSLVASSIVQLALPGAVPFRSGLQFVRQSLGCPPGNTRHTYIRTYTPSKYARETTEKNEKRGCGAVAATDLERRSGKL